mgnify:FL=1
MFISKKPNPKIKAILLMEYRVYGGERNIGRHYCLYEDNENKDLICWTKYKSEMLEYVKDNNIIISKSSNLAKYDDYIAWKKHRQKTKINILSHLNSKQWEWEMDTDLDVIVFNDYSEFNEDTDVRLCLPTSLFNKEVFYQPRWSSDPTDVQSREGINITEVGDDYTDEWDSSDIAEIFFKNIEKIEILKQ